ncbi:hypothetical protein MASR2M18_00270 [Ignavibacteria bacterium]|nr:DUF1624 domain-containing protein [Bacteroidota bacterium]MCZ2131901.1 DUF1624 domain-containing protein [Bacteroidota bacterium]
MNNASYSADVPSSKSDNRLYALDLARFIAMLMMMQGHTLDSLVDSQYLDTSIFPWNIWSFIRGLTAPVFLMVSGAVHVFAMKRDESGRMTSELMKRRIRWAFIILAVGYLLVFPANRIFDLPFIELGAWKGFFQVNILQLTAVTLMGVVWLSRKTRSVESLGKYALGIGLGILLLAPAIHSLDVFALLPEPLAAFFSYRSGSIFPIFPFSAFMFLGVAIGAFLKCLPTSAGRTEYIKKKGLYAAVATFGIAAVVWAIYLAVPMPNLNYQLVHPAFMLLRAGIVLAIFTVAAYISGKTTSFNKHYSFFSTKSLHIYVIHLVLLYGTPWFNSVARWYPKLLTLEQGLALVPAIVGTTILIVLASNYVQKNIRLGDAFLRYSFGTVLAYALLR